MKLFYIFQDPMGSDDSKVGVTSHTKVRLGTYQNSYSSRSHLAQFDIAYTGSPRVIDKLEKEVKRKFDWDIENDGRGHTEWVSHFTPEMIEKEVDKIIEGFHFKVTKIPAKFLPITVNNFDDLLTEQQT